MIYGLRRRFILICTVSVLAVIALVFGFILALNISSMNKNLDILADRVSEGGGRFPGVGDEGPHPDKKPPKNEHSFDFITPETPYSTRHFTVVFDASGNVNKTYTEAIISITDEMAVDYAKECISKDRMRGWISNYRYKIIANEFGKTIVFVDGSMSRASLMQSATIAGIVLLVSAALILILIFLLSTRAVKPIAESYEKQKQFITDASHELKTPLTLILTNLDIAESELGKNEWLDDIRFEGNRMRELVNQLVVLSRMDEDGHPMNLTEVALGKLVVNTVSEFGPLAESREKRLLSDIDAEITCIGDEGMLQRLLGILMDNALKYCDSNGEIKVSLQKGRKIVLTIENTYSDVGEIQLDRLFDRFYRADKARTFSGGYGIGLSMAKVIVSKHKGDISAYKKGDSFIGFKVVM